MAGPNASPEERLLTKEEFQRLPKDDRYRYELVRGRLVRDPRPGPRHGRMAVKLGRLLDEFAERNGLGLVFTETGYALYRDPDTVRGPDLSYVSEARLPPSGYADSYWTLAPDLAVEIPSPSNRAGEIRDKVREYLAAGVRLVWLVDPARRTVTVHRPDAVPVQIEAGGVLEGEDVVPGFAVSLAELFGRR